MSRETSIEKFDGGLSKVDSTNIKDDQFEVLTNFIYNSEREPESRKGISEFSTVPDSVTTINTCEATTDWTAAGDASNLTLDTTNEIRGAGCLNFDVDAYSTGSATLTLAASATVDITGWDYLAFWVNFPTSYDTLLTDVKVQMGSDSSNYYEWTLTNPTEATDTMMKLDKDDATTTGTPVDASTDYFKVIVTTASGYAGTTDWLVDDIKAYSATTTKPITSIFMHKVQSTGVRWLIAMAGTSMYLYNEDNTAWEEINSGLTEFETGSTTNRTKWDFLAFGDVVYMCNGVDNYRWWNGTTIGTAAGPFGRYMAYANNRGFIAGRDTDPEVVYYTGANPSNLQTYGNNTGVGSQGEGRINSIAEFGSSFLVFKGKKVYATDVSTTPETHVPVSMQNGGHSHRVTNIVGNGMLYETDAGVDNLAYKVAATGNEALETEEFTADLRKLTREIAPRQLNSNVGYYAKNKTNFYFMFDTGDDYRPDTTLVYSAITGTWTQHNLPSIYDFTEYENASGEILHLASSALGGVVYQLDSGFDDDGSAISCELVTKNWDLGDVGTRKEFEYVTIMGRKSEGQDVDIEIIVDNDVVGEGTITDEYLLEASESVTLGDDVLSEEALGGGEIVTSVTNDLEMFPYLIRIYVYGDGTGQRLKVRMTSDTTPIQWTLNKINIQDDDEIIFSEDYIA